MLKFIKDYSSVLLAAMPILYLSGKVFGPLAILVSVLFGLMYWSGNKRGHIIILFLLVLILGDVRESELSFYKPMRIAVLMVITAWTAVDLSKKRVKWLKSFSWLIPFMILSLVSLVIASPIKFTSFQKTLSYLFVVMISFHFIAPWLVKKQKNLHDLIYFMGLILVIGLVNYMIRPEAVLLGNRFEGAFGNPNGLGLACMMWTPFLYTAYRQSKDKKKWVFIGVFLLLSLVMSGSRNSLATVMLFFGFQFIFKTKRRRRLVFWSVPILYILITSIDWIALIQAIGLGDYLRVEGIETASGRTLSWAFAVSIIPQHFWMGGGFAYQEYVYLNLVPEELQIFREMSSTWNSYLTFMLNNGAIGTGAFVIFLFAQARSALSKWPATGFVVAFMLGAIFETWMTASLNSFTIYFYIFLGYLQFKSPFS